MFSHGESNSRRVCVLFHRNFQHETGKISRDNEGRRIIVEILNSTSVDALCLCGIYAPNTDTPKFFADTIDETLNFPDSKLIIGDFNLTLNVDIDRKGSVWYNNKSKEVLLSAMDELLFVDT